MLILCLFCFLSNKNEETHFVVVVVVNGNLLHSVTVFSFKVIFHLIHYKNHFFVYNHTTVQSNNINARPTKTTIQKQQQKYEKKTNKQMG